MNKNGKEVVCRVSVSLQESVYEKLDFLVKSRGFESRSQAIAEMISQEAAEHAVEMGDEIMTGTITLVYWHGKPGLKQQLAEIECENVAEVITSQHILLEDQHTMEVILVQGPANKLKKIANQLITCKGIKTGKLNLTANLMPPLHAKSESITEV